MAQAESSNQVDVLLTMYLLRMTCLDTARDLDHFNAAKIKRKEEKTISVSKLTPIVTKTRKLLQASFDHDFFSWYVVRDRIRDDAFLFEMRLYLHPKYKDIRRYMTPVITVCSISAGLSPDAVGANVDRVSNAVLSRIKGMIMSLALEQCERATNDTAEADDQFSNEYDRTFVAVRRPAVETRETSFNVVDTELTRWKEDTSYLQANPGGTKERILDFWKRKASEAGYKFLPMIARVLFAAPASSAQIESTSVDPLYYMMR
ncbi:hypothetical protein PINS_up008573 [Pythium insidiosum]|nr:hypothetical protein PINS_up008573 [Pythium insidiosum]